MALGCFLWISGICFLLFNGSVGLPTIKEYAYPYNTDSRNMGDNTEDEKLLSYDWQPSDGQPRSAAYSSYIKSPAGWEPILVASQQTEPSAPAVKRFVNSESRDWNLKTPNSPLLFPLSQNYKPSNPAGPQPGANTGSSAHGSGSQNVPHLVYEDIFQYPSENAEQSPSDDVVSNTAGGPGQAYSMSKGSSSGYSPEPSYQRYPSDAGAHQVASSAKGSSPPAQISYQAQIPVASQEEEVSVSVDYPPPPPHDPRPPPPPPPPVHIVQSRDGFVRVRYLLNKSRYSPAAVNSEPKRKQPAAPVGVKNPQRKG